MSDILRIVLLVGLATLGACASGRPGGSYLYEDGVEPPRLKHSEIRMTTRRRSGPELRLITCVDGVITGRVKSRIGNGEAPMPFDAYASLWSRLMDADAMAIGIDAEDVDGGLYHHVQLVLGRKGGQFSAQNRKVFIGVSNRNISKRMDLSNAIVKALADHVPLEKPEKEPAKKQEPKK